MLKFPVPPFFCSAIKFYSGVKTPYGPCSFLHTMWMSSSDLAGYAQQDAHEFFISALNQIHAKSPSKLIRPLCQFGSSFTPKKKWWSDHSLSTISYALYSFQAPSLQLYYPQDLCRRLAVGRNMWKLCQYYVCIRPNFGYFSRSAAHKAEQIWTEQSPWIERRTERRTEFFGRLPWPVRPIAYHSVSYVFFRFRGLT